MRSFQKDDAEIEDSIRTNTSLQPKKQNENIPKLLRLPRVSLDPYMYSSRVIDQRNFTSKSFRLVLRPINSKLLQRINDGPKYLSGNYPLGLLKEKHEKRRYLDPNVVGEKRLSGWREDENQDETHLHHSYRQSSLIKRPLLVNGKASITSILDTPMHTYLPVLVITGKKAIDNRAVIRNKSKTKLLYAFQQGLKSKQIKNIKWPFYDQFGDPLAFIFYPSKQIIDDPMPDLIKSCSVIIETIAKRYERDPSFSKEYTNRPNNRKSSPSRLPR